MKEATWENGFSILRSGFCKSQNTYTNSIIERKTVKPSIYELPPSYIKVGLQTSYNYYIL